MLPRERQEEVSPLLAEVCAALASPHRVAMLCALAERPYHVTALAAYLGLSQPVTSRHLKVLRAQGLVCASRRGAMMEYRLADPRLLEATKLLREVVQERLARRASLLAASSSDASLSQSS